MVSSVPDLVEVIAHGEEVVVEIAHLGLDELHSEKVLAQMNLESGEVLYFVYEECLPVYDPLDHPELELELEDWDLLVELVLVGSEVVLLILKALE